jgi:hypothetical protein
VDAPRRRRSAGVVDAQAIIDDDLRDADRQSRPSVERLLEVILEELPDAQHQPKWGRLTFTRDGDWHHWICAISPTKNAVKLVVHKGGMLADPHGVMEGAGRYTRTIPFRTPDDIDPGVVTAILPEAAKRQMEMLPDEPG